MQRYKKQKQQQLRKNRMENRICYIVCAGDNTGTAFIKKENDYVIAVDAGYEVTKELGINPDMTVGDFDSLGYVPKGENVYTYCAEKDETDTMIAVKKALELGHKNIIIFGGTGKRADHTIANLQTMLYASRHGAKILMKDSIRGYIIITDDTHEFSDDYKGNLSVFAIGGKADGVDIYGAKYELRNADLRSDMPLGVSNLFAGNEVTINVKNGSLLIVFDIN